MKPYARVRTYGLLIINICSAHKFMQQLIQHDTTLQICLFVFNFTTHWFVVLQKSKKSNSPCIYAYMCNVSKVKLYYKLSNTTLIKFVYKMCIPNEVFTLSLKKVTWQSRTRHDNITRPDTMTLVNGLTLVGFGPLSGMNKITIRMWYIYNF